MLCNFFLGENVQSCKGMIVSRERLVNPLKHMAKIAIATKKAGVILSSTGRSRCAYSRTVCS